MEKLLEDLHQDLKQLNVNYQAHAMVENIMRQYKQRLSEEKEEQD